MSQGTYKKGGNRSIFDGTRIVESRVFASASLTNVKVFGLEFFGCLYFQNRSRYLPHIWYGPTLEHWLLLYKTMSLGLAPGWGQRSISRMMLMLKFLVKVFFDAYISKTIQGTCLIFGMDLP